MVKITTGAAVGARTVAMPSDAELRTLAKIVTSQLPRLNPGHDADYNAHSFEREFRRAFFAVGHMGRLSSVETKNAKSLDLWAAYASDILSDFDFPESDVNGRTFAMAVLAWGDVEHTVGPRFPLDALFGLTYQHAGRASSPDGWRRVIDAGQLRPTSSLPYRVAPLEVKRSQPQTTVYAGFVGSIFS